MTLVNTVLQNGDFGIYSCRNCSVRNLVLTNAKDNFSQGTITQINTTNPSITVTIDPGYDDLDRPDLARPSRLKVFPVNGSPAWDQSYQPRITDIAKVGPRNWRIAVDSAPYAALVGKKVVYWPGGGTFSFDIIGCANITVEDVKDYPRMGSCGFAPRACTGTITFRHYDVGCPPGSHDLLTSSGVSQGADNRGTLVLDHCDWSGFDDDGVNQLTPWVNVLDHPQANELTVKYDVYQQGDTVSLWDWTFGHAHERVEAKVVSVQHNSDNTDTLTLDRSVEVGKMGPQVRHDLTQIMHDGIDRLIDLDTVGSAIIKNCRISCRRARPILIKSRNAVIENCTIYDSHSPGIQAGAEMYWNEGPQTLNLTVRGCTFENIDTAAVDVGLFADGSDASYDCKNITIENNIFRNNGQRTTSRPWLKYGYGPQGVGVRVRNAVRVIVRHNTFINNPGANIVIQYCKNVAVIGNTFEKSNDAKVNANPEQVGDNGAAVWLDHVDGATIFGNKVSNPGRYYEHLIAATPTCSGLKIGK